MPPAGFEPAIPAGERLQTLALDRSATGIDYAIWCAYFVVIVDGRRTGPSASSERGNDPLGFVNGGKFPNLMSDYLLLKNSDLWNYPI